MPTSLQAIAMKARDQKQHRFLNLYRLIDEQHLHQSWWLIRQNAAYGVDRISAADYEQKLDDNIRNLVERLKQKNYRARLVRRHWIPKPDGRMRPLGIPVVEDKLLQLAVARILGAIYEQDFLPCSYGYRPNRGALDAVQDLTVKLQFEPYNFIVEADIEAFFDRIDHDKLIEMLSRRIADKQLLRLIQKWLKAGVLETDGQVTRPVAGSPQGGVISPTLANVYLHYGAPGQTWCFQRVKFPPRQEVQPPHRESSLGSEEVTNRIKRRQSDARAVTKVKRLSLVKYLTAGRQYRSGWKAPVGTPQTARWPETAAGSESTARSETEASRDLGDPLWSWSASKQIEYAGR
jgi:hypothetical protein